MCVASGLWRFAQAAALLTVVSALSQKALSCPCGSTGKNYTFHLSVREKGCQTWSNCLKCQDEVDYCLECPVGLFGPTCSQISCHDPGSVPNADRIDAEGRTTHHPGQSVEFVCHDGLKQHGTSTLTCLESGTWSGMPPICSRKSKTRPGNKLIRMRRARTYWNECPDHGVPTHAVRRLHGPLNPASFPPGTYIWFECDEGFRINGEMATSCLPDGNWSNPLPTCLPRSPPSILSESISPSKPIYQRASDTDLVECPDPGVPSNGKRNVNNPNDPRSFEMGTSLWFECDADFQRFGRNASLCLALGKWSDPFPTCYPAKNPCPDPGVPSHAVRTVLRPPNAPPFLQGSMLKHECEEGFQLQGWNIMVCLTGGNWSSPMPTCSPVPRPEPQDGPFSIDQYREMIGNESNTNWNGCPDPGVPSNGVRIETNALNAPPYPRVGFVQFICMKGFRLLGKNSSMCLNGEKWSSPTPTCLPVPLFMPWLGDRLISQFHPISAKPADDLLVKCGNPGIFLNGRVTVMKLIYLLPDEHIFSKRIMNMRDQVVRTPDEDFYPQGTYLSYQCDEGYRGGNSIQCQDTGIWLGKPPICTQVCGYPGPHEVQGDTTDSVVEWPWMVGVASLSNESSHLTCGGVLLNKRTVLTTANCFLGNETFKLLFGKYRSRTVDKDEEVFQRTNFTVKIHPNFNKNTHTADIAMVHFSPEINFTPHIRAICLPNVKTNVRHLARGRHGFVASWGLTRDLKTPDSYLMFQFRVSSSYSCRRDYERNNRTVPTERKTFCAEPSEAQVNICDSEGGSPMMYFGRSRDGIYNIEGMSSVEHSNSCGRLRRYTIFTQVLPYVPWIEENMP